MRRDVALQFLVARRGTVAPAVPGLIGRLLRQEFAQQALGPAPPACLLGAVGRLRLGGGHPSSVGRA